MRRIRRIQLFALQHRGQESAGIVVNDDGVFTSHKGLGLVNEVFGREEMKNRSLSSRQGAGDCRKSPSGLSDRFLIRFAAYAANSAGLF